MIYNIISNVFDANAAIIAHQVNCMGVMGSGVAAEVKRRFPDVYTAYKQKCDENYGRSIKLLGTVQICPVTFLNDGRPRTYIANLFGQYHYGRDRSIRYTNYDALEQCFSKLAEFAMSQNLRIAIPYKIGCGLGGGDWNNMVMPMIERTLAGCEVLIARY